MNDKGHLLIVYAIFIPMFLLGIVISEDLLAQANVTNDWKLTKIGQVRQLVQNKGRMGYGANYSNYPGLIMCEYPAGSGMENVTRNNILIGGVIPGSNAPVVSVGMGYSSPDELWPTEAPWDTIWVVNQGETVDIGGYQEDGTLDIYWPNYTATSDEDYVCRFNDYRILNPTIGGSMRGMHNPMYLDIIQVVSGWSSPPLDEILRWTWYIIPTKFDVENMYFAHYSNPQIGLVGSNLRGDDALKWYQSFKMHGGVDGKGGSDGDAGAIAFKMFTPEGYEQNELTWSYIRLPGMGPDYDEKLYDEVLSSGIIMDEQMPGMIGGIHCYYSVGPLSVAVGDTLVMRMVQIHAQDEDQLMENAEAAIGTERDLPSAPPVPPLRAVASNKQVYLDWSPTAEVNPETYVDPVRADSNYVDQPFEGYRLYKSTVSKEGPWVKLAEYDVPGNSYGYNTGLSRDYTDEGLLNNIEYYYAVTAYTKPDSLFPWPALETSKAQNVVTIVPGPQPPETVGRVAVVPNPYRGDIAYHEYNPPWENSPTGRTWMEQDRRVQFINLPEKCVIKIYSASGDFVAKLNHSDPDRGYEDWNLTSYVNQAIASGLYLFTVEDSNTGKKQVGKFVVIK